MNELDTTPRVVRTGGLLIAGDGKRGSDTLLPFAFSVMLFAAWYFPFTSVADFVGFKADDAVYLLMADDYSPFRPAEPVLDYVRRMSHLPPLYPALLGWLGAGSGEVDVAHLIQTTCLLSSLFTLGLLTARLTADRPTALMLMWLFAISPATVFLSTEIWSEFLYLTLANAALALVVFSQRQHSLWYAVALLAGLSTITRGIGLLLIIALATNLFARKVPKRWLIIFLALVPMVAMELWQFGGGSEYFDIYQKKRVTEAIGMIAQIHATVLAVWSGWLSLFDPTPRYPTVVIAALALPLAVVGGWPRLRSFEVDALYAAAYLGVLMLWPFPAVAGRILYPLAPLLCIYALLGCRQLHHYLTRAASPNALRIPIAVLLVLTLPSAATLALRYLAEAPPPELADYRSSQYWLGPDDRAEAAEDLVVKAAMVQTMRAANRLVPATDCIYALDPQAVMYYSRRLSWPPPVGADRPIEPACRFQLVLSDHKLFRGMEALWPGYQVAYAGRTTKGVAGMLMEYQR